MDQGLQVSGNRPRAESRSFSLRSDKSHDKAPLSLTQSQINEKQRRDSLLRGESKANPNAAMLEIQPAALAATERNTLSSLRDSTYKDTHGNTIAEPDLCNPTRPRWERPLDTIRSFEKAIDGGYQRRSTSRSDLYDANNHFASRRSSYYGGYDNGPSPSRYSQTPQNGYYAGSGNRRTESYFDINGQPGPAPPSRNRLSQRLTSGDRRTPSHGAQIPHDEAHGSDSTGPWNTSTNPSSENSSIDRLHALGKPDGYSHDGAIPEEYGMPNGNGYPARNGNGYGAPQPTQAQPTRQPIKLSGGEGYSAPVALPSTARTTDKDEKKKGFFKKRFGKNKD